MCMQLSACLHVCIRFTFGSLAVGPEPFLIFGHGNAIFRMDLDGLDQRRVVARAGTSVHLDFHLPSGVVYWANGQTGIISRAATDGTKRQVSLTSASSYLHTHLFTLWKETAVFWAFTFTVTFHIEFIFRVIPSTTSSLSPSKSSPPSYSVAKREQKKTWCEHRLSYIIFPPSNHPIPSLCLSRSFLLQRKGSQAWQWTGFTMFSCGPISRLAPFTRPS